MLHTCQWTLQHDRGHCAASQCSALTRPWPHRMPARVKVRRLAAHGQRGRMGSERLKLRRPPEASRPARRVCYWSSSPWQGGIHSHIVTGERDESLSLMWFWDKLRLTVRRQVPVVVAIEHVCVVDHLLPDGGGGRDAIGQPVRSKLAEQ